MTRMELLLVQLMEECAEVSQRASKAIRFGLDEVQPGQDRTNRQRISDEMIDLYATTRLLEVEGLLLHLEKEDHDRYIKKQAQIQKFLDYSKELGILKD